MTETIESLRNIALLLFWAMAYLVLIGLWAALILGVLLSLIEGTKNDD